MDDNTDPVARRHGCQDRQLGRVTCICRAQKLPQLRQTVMRQGSVMLNLTSRYSIRKSRLAWRRVSLDQLFIRGAVKHRLDVAQSVASSDRLFSE